MAYFNLNWIKNNLRIESVYGQRALSELSPYKNGQEVEARLFFDRLNSIIGIFKENSELFNDFHRLFMGLRNICGTLNNLRNSMVLGETELFEIKNFAIIVSDIINLCNKYNIESKLFADIDIESVIRLLNPEFLITGSFYIYEAWSEKLKNIREHKKLIESQILASSNSDEKSRLRAFRADIVNDEADEELRIRKNLSEKLKNYLPVLDSCVECLGKLELLLAKAQLALEFGCGSAEIYDTDSIKSIVVENAVEPELAEILNKKGKLFTPVNIKLQKGVTILTGANMGGKSFALATIAFNTELVRYGFLPFAQRISMKIPGFIENITGDNQDFNAGLSSFGADIKRLCTVLEKIKSDNGIVICDEFGRTTNPYEGSRFVRALCDRLQKSNSFAILATHYDGVCTANAAYYQVLGLKNILSSGIEKNLSGTESLSDFMDYRLVESTMNSEVPREALNIAAILGLPEDFVKSIEKYYN